MNLKPKLAVGSRNKIKLTATTEAATFLDYNPEILSFAVTSVVSPQPLGIRETYLGAKHRMNSMRAVAPERIAIGIESGLEIVGTDKRVLDFAVIVLAHPDGRPVIVASSPMFELPFWAFEKAADCKYSKTIGEFIAEKMGGNASDPHRTVSEGKTSRADLIRIGLISALTQL